MYLHVVTHVHKLTLVILVPKKKFIVPHGGKSWVLGSVGSKWRAYKGKVKDKHYTPYTTMAEMVANRPNAIPKEEFIDLMKYFASDKAKVCIEARMLLPFDCLSQPR